jgi:hypothetical protein
MSGSQETWSESRAEEIDRKAKKAERAVKAAYKAIQDLREFTGLVVPDVGFLVTVLHTEHQEWMVVVAGEWPIVIAGEGAIEDRYTKAEAEEIAETVRSDMAMYITAKILETGSLPTRIRIDQRLPEPRR